MEGRDGSDDEGAAIPRAARNNRPDKQIVEKRTRQMRPEPLTQASQETRPDVGNMDVPLTGPSFFTRQGCDMHEPKRRVFQLPRL